MREFEELRIRFRRVGAGRYLVLANGPASATAVTEISESPASCRDEYEGLVSLAFGPPPAGVDVDAQRRSLGRRVFAALLPEPIQKCIVESLGLSQDQGRGLRLRFDLPDELRAFPLECMTSPAGDALGPIALNSNLSIARSMPSSNAPGLRRVDARSDPSRLHLLVAVASPRDMPLDATVELAEIGRLPELTVETTVQRATRDDIGDWLARHTANPTAVLLIAHGSYDESTGGVVHFEGRRRRSHDPVSAQELSGMLNAAQRLRFVVLNLCMGAVAAPREPFSGLAQHIIGWGVPAVVAMQAPIGNDAASRFSPALLRGLLANQTIDEALVTARARIAGDLGGRIEWCTPALFLHQDCGHGWLHKARAVAPTGAPLPDPLRDGAEAVDVLIAGVGNVSQEAQVLAARHRRLARDWRGVLSAAHTHGGRDDLRRLIDEARVELAGAAVDRCCAALAEPDDAEARLQLAAMADEDLPSHLVQCLSDEIERATRLNALYGNGIRAQEENGWKAAAGSFREVLNMSPTGFRDTGDRLRVVELHERAEQLIDREAGWAEVVGTYVELLGVAPADRVARGMEAYAAGRVAEETPDWAAASENYGRCPDDLLDVPQRRAYAQGRAATDWSVAREAFAAAGTRAVGWLAYATARAAEAGGEWANAVQAYSEVAAKHAAEFGDAANRMCYAMGRAAEQTEGGPDWRAVINGFGPLPDDYADGDVGRRRSFARACLAERQAERSGGNWEAVLEPLAGLADTEFDGAVAVLRGKAAGRQAEQDHLWAEARDRYARVADANPELANLHRYAQARAAERAEPPQWTEALEHYRELSPDFRDVKARQAYSRARHEEQRALADGRWRSTVDAYAEAATTCADGPPEFADTPQRWRYARVRLAAAGDDWAKVGLEAGGLPPDYYDAPLFAAYAGGMLAEREREPDLRAVRQAFGRCGRFLDAEARLAYWGGRSSERDGQWTAAVGHYREAGSVLDAPDRLARLEGMLDLAWVSKLAGATLLADPHAVCDPESPYDVLREVGIDPGSSDEEIRAASYTLLRQGRTGRRWRAAWDGLRFLDRRLRVDALHYPVRDPVALRDRLNEAGSPEGLLAHLLETLPAEAPLLKLVSRGREHAITAWEEVLRRAPADTNTVHCLAIAHLWRAQELDTNGAQELAEHSWQASIACWAVLLTDDAYWSRWRTLRERAYGRPVLAADIAQLRRDLRQDLVDRLAGHRDRHGRNGLAERARAYQRLIRLVDVELDGARVLSEVGGLGLAGDGAERGDRPERALAVGPGYVRLAGLVRPLAEFVAHWQSEEDSREGADELDLRRLRCAFSELATALMLMEHQWPDDALRALPELGEQSLTNLPADCAGPGMGDGADDHLRDCGHCADFLARNPAYVFLPRRRARLLQDTLDLAVRARMALARNALTSVRPDTERALAVWADAIGLASRAGTTVRTKQAITRMVLGRVDALTSADGPQQGRALGEAIGLLERALPVVGAAGGSALRASLSELLTDRGVWYGYACVKYGGSPNMELAQADLRRSLEMNPGSARTRDNLVRALVFGLTNRTDRPVPPNSSRTWAQLGEAWRILHEGMLRQTDPEVFRDVLSHTLEAIESQVFSRLSFAAVAALTLDVAGAGTDRRARAASLAAHAEARLSGGEVPEALHDLVRATRLDPAEPRIRRLLLDAIESWRARLEAEERRSA